MNARRQLERLPGVAVVDGQPDHRADWEPSDLDAAYAERLAAIRAGRAAALRTR